MNPAEPIPPRAAKIAAVLVAPLTAPGDIHSVEELCHVAPIGVAQATFRRWCNEEGISPGQALAFARLLRAVIFARKDRTSASEWMEIDPRTFRRLLKRAGVVELFAGEAPTPWDFIEVQHLVLNPHVLSLVRQSLLGVERQVF
ncbi:MAG: hypothetical protein ACM4AI_08335 [Acidobacteriota bacterium]